MDSIKNKTYNIQGAFRDCYYIIPDYQREYVWTDKEVNQLLDDIDEQINTSESREYFIGTVLVSRSTKRDEYEVIDGQQRLTTFFLFLCAIRNLSKSLGDDESHKFVNALISTSHVNISGDSITRLRLVPRYENAEELIEKVVELDVDPQAARVGIQSAGIRIYGSLENLINAYNILYEYIKERFLNSSDLKRYFGYLVNRVIFIQIFSPDVSSTLKIFETINERGIGLNPMDLLKNLLFTQVKQEEFNKLKIEWKKITKPLEDSKEKPLRFLRYFLMANYSIKNERGDAVVREDEIYDWFINKENASLCGYAKNPFYFVREVTHNVESYLGFTNGLGNDGKPNLAMENLKRLVGGAFSLHYVLLLAAVNFPKKLFDHFVRQLEVFLFYYIFTRTSTRELERNFSLWADYLQTIAEEGDQAIQGIKLNEFIFENFEKNIVDKSQELTDALNRFTLNSMQQYRVRYFLAKLTQYVDMAYQGAASLYSLDPYMNLQFEHILPNTPSQELLESWNEDNPEAIYDEYKNRLGNIALLEKPINIVASNNFYAIKQQEYSKSGNYLTRSLVALSDVGANTSISRINEKLESFQVWSAAAIDRRQSLLIDLSKDVWKISSI